MKPNDQKLLAGVVLFAVAMAMLVAVVFDGCAPAQAAAQPVPAITPTLALGRTFVREAGIRAYERDDPTAIAAVLSFRAEYVYHSTFLEALMRYTQRAPLRTDLSRAWIAQLSTDDRRPPLWPMHLRWQGRHEVWWSRTYQHAREIVRGDREHRCELTPHDWGNEADAARYLRRNPDAVVLDCGRTCRRDGTRCNVFLHLPRYARFDET